MVPCSTSRTRLGRVWRGSGGARWEVQAEVGSWRRWRRWGWGGVPREGLQGSLSGYGSTPFGVQFFSFVDVPVILQAVFKQSKMFFWMVPEIQFVDRVL